LKPDNILICNGKLKIADFGLATIIGVENKKPFFYKSITPKEVDQEGHSIQSDIYALGCCFLRMFSQDAEKIVSSANLWQSHVTNIIKKCCATQKRDQYNSCKEILRDFDRIENIAKEEITWTSYNSNNGNNDPFNNSSTGFKSGYMSY